MRGLEHHQWGSLYAARVLLSRFCFREYLMNIRVVDAGIQKVVQLIDKFYGSDGKTAYVMTADHGMTDWGQCISLRLLLCVAVFVQCLSVHLFLHFCDCLCLFSVCLSISLTISVYSLWLSLWDLLSLWLFFFFLRLSQSLSLSFFVSLSLFLSLSLCLSVSLWLFLFGSGVDSWYRSYLPSAAYFCKVVELFALHKLGVHTTKLS